MNETSAILFDTATRLFEDVAGDEVARAARRGELVQDAWSGVAEAGLPLALLSEDQGGFGLPAADAFNLVRIAGAFAAPLPLAETMVANRLLAEAGLPLAGGTATFAVVDDARVARNDAGWAVATTACHVPWGREVDHLVLVGGGHVVRVARAAIDATPLSAQGDLPRASITLAATVDGGMAAPLPAALDADAIRATGALMRAMEMAGALRSVLAISVGYAGERIQFGRPLGKFQAVQQQLAVMADEVAAANAAADLAAEAFGADGADLAIAVAKVRVGEAAGIAAGIAHQVLGAIGFTQEHRLHLFTRALWLWRDEYGGETHWQRRLGAAALARGADGFWPFITSPALAGVAA